MGLSEQTTVKELFLRSCKKNDVSAARYFLSLGADVNWKGVWAGLHWAARDNFRELLELLLTQSGVNVNIYSKDKDFLTTQIEHRARYNSFDYDHQQLSLHLVIHGLSPHTQNFDHCTA